MSEQFIYSMWIDYKNCIPKNAGDVQIKETRRAFYAGCSAIFALLVNDFSEMEQDKAEMSMDSVLEELNRFVDKVKLGKA